MFNAEKVCADITLWIRNWFFENGRDCNAVIGISGGKDSSVTAALCTAALGKERVVGVMMPNGVQPDIDVAQRVITLLGIRGVTINIGPTYSALMDEVKGAIACRPSAQTEQNMAPRLRMTAIYAVSQSLNGRVANTCNLSEDWVGYSTRWGDSVGDFSPLSNLTVGEVKQLGRCLGLPSELVDKAPADGLCGKTDEDNLGFTYAMLDSYIRTGVCPDKAVKEEIDRRHAANLFKLSMAPSFPYTPDM